MATLNYFVQRGKPSKEQLNILDIYNVPDLLFQRGFEEVSEGQIDGTLLDASVNHIFKKDENGIPNWSVYEKFMQLFACEKL